MYFYNIISNLIISFLYTIPFEVIYVNPIFSHIALYCFRGINLTLKNSSDITLTIVYSICNKSDLDKVSRNLSHRRSGSASNI